MGGAIAFILAGGAFDFDMKAGLVVLGASIIIRSFYFVITEKYVQKTLARCTSYEKQFITACFDFIGYLLFLYVEINIENRSLNPFAGFFSTWVTPVAVLLKISISIGQLLVIELVNSLFYQLVLALVLCGTWVTKLTLFDSETFVLVRIPIVMIITCAVLADTYLENKKSKAPRNIT